MKRNNGFGCSLIPVPLLLLGHGNWNLRVTQGVNTDIVDATMDDRISMIITQ